MTMITPSYLGETIEYSSLHACRSTLEDPTGGWVLSRSLADASLFELYGAMQLPLAGGWRFGDAAAPWQRRVVAAMNRVAAAESGAMRISLAELLDEPAPAPQPIDLSRHRK